MAQTIEPNTPNPGMVDPDPDTNKKPGEDPPIKPLTE